MGVPTVSILVPVFNRENLIASCLDSILGQSYADFEVVVVDNASTDRTFEICREYSARDARVRVFRNNSNIGPVRNWMRCLELAQGRLAKIVFSDDLMFPDFLSETVPLLDDEQIAFAFTPVAAGPTPEKSVTLYQWFPTNRTESSEFYLSELFRGASLPVSPGCALFRASDLRKNLYLRIPVPRGQDFAAHGAGPDLLLYLLAARDYQKVAFVCRPLNFFRAHEGSLSATGDRIALGYLQAKAWFSDRFMPHSVRDQLLVESWIELMKKRRAWVRPVSYFGEFIPDPRVSWRIIGTRLFRAILANLFKIHRLISD